MVPDARISDRYFIMLINLDYFGEFCQHILDITKVNFTEVAL